MALANTTANIYDIAFLTGTLSAQTLLNYANDAHKTAPDFSFRHNKWCPLRECNPPLSCGFLRHMFWSTVTGRPQPVDSLWMVHCWTRREAPWQNVNNCRDGCMRTRCSISQQDPARTLTTSRRTERPPHPQPGRDSATLVPSIFSSCLQLTSIHRGICVRTAAISPFMLWFSIPRSFTPPSLSLSQTVNCSELMS